MKKLQSYLLAVICAANLVNISLGRELHCSSNSNENVISLSVNSVWSDAREWTTSFLAYQNSSVQPTNVEVNVTRRFVTCPGRNIIQIEGIMKEIFKTPDVEIITFKGSSSNAAITNYGRTLEKVKMGQSGLGVTSRHLKGDEIFAVRVDAKDGRYYASGPAIGLTTLTLEGQDLLDHGNSYKSGTWMLQDTDLYQNGSIIRKSYLKKDLSTLQVGKTIGMTRTRNGTLHFFVDGVDQGPAASNIPANVYGIFELYGTRQGTIVDV